MNNFHRLVVYFGIVSALGACQDASQSPAHTELARGDQQLAMGKVREAISHYEKSLSLQASAAAERGLGVAYAELAEWSRAIDHLTKARRAGALDSELHAISALAYAGVGDHAKCREHATIALQAQQNNRDQPQSPLATLVLAAIAQTPEEKLVARESLQALETSARSHKRDVPLELTVALDALADTPPSAAGPRVDAPLANLPLALGLSDVFQRAGKSAAAERLLRGLVSAAPTTETAWVRLTDLALVRGDRVDALAAIAKVPERPDEPAAIGALRARVAMLDQRAAEGCKLLTAAIGRAAAEERDALILLLARCFIEEGKPDEARKHLLDVAARSTHFERAYLALAELEMRTARPAAVIEAMQALLEKKPDAVRALYWLGRAHALQGDDQRASQMLEQYLRAIGRENAFGGDPDARLHLALVMKKLGDETRARGLLEAALDGAPRSLPTLAALTDMLSPAEAEARIRKQLQRVPDERAFDLLLASSMARQGRAQEAEQQYRKLLASDPKHVGTKIELAMFLHAQKRTDEALALVDAAHELEPRNPVVLGMLATLHQARKDFARAAEAYALRLKDAPNDAAVLNNLALLKAEQLGDVAAGVELAERAHRVAPNSPAIADTLGWILLNAGQVERALPLLERAAAALPRDPDVQRHLAAAKRKALKPSAQ